MAVRIIRRGEVGIHFRDEGATDAPLTLLFSNSLGTDLRIWDDVVARFADTARIVRYDKRGHGISDAPPAPYSLADHVADAHALLDHLDIAHAVVVGVSVGGMIAQGLAVAHPARVTGLVLCDTAARIGTGEAWEERIAAIRAGGLESIADGIMERWFSSDFRSRAPGELSLWRNLLVRTPVEGYVGTCAALAGGDLTTDIGGLNVPVLCICGDEDGATPPELVRELAASIPGARYLEVANAGHLPCIEQPTVMADAIAEFLAENDLD
ncbi:MAG: 3-oxoadipate enol-lactonase [Alphaproteobacteria bacterium]